MYWTETLKTVLHTLNLGKSLHFSVLSLLYITVRVLLVRMQLWNEVDYVDGAWV